MTALQRNLFKYNNIINDELKITFVYSKIPKSYYREMIRTSVL